MIAWLVVFNISQAHAEMHALIDLVQTELEAQIGRHLDKLLGRQGANMAMGMHGFAEVVRNNMTAIPQQACVFHCTGLFDVAFRAVATVWHEANVKVVASDMPYPSVVSLVQDRAILSCRFTIEAPRMFVSIGHGDEAGHQ